MRPIRLEMTAFGSYAEHTVIPFSELKQNLYLVAGDTGAGKTTIFDAITFALYGKASGANRNKPEMLHCDMVDKSTKTEVFLTFSHAGKEYSVYRTIQFRKVSGEQKASQKATLYEPGREPVTGQTNVTERCTEILGLNADQFRKIIMLAQGEFREFLKADSSQKAAILGKLFDNSAYLYFQNLLRETCKKLDGERETYVRDGKTQVENVLRLPDGESREPYLWEREDLLDNLKSLAEADGERLKELDAERDAAQKKLDSLNGARGAAEANNALFGQLTKFRETAERLRGQEAAFREREAALERTKRAVREAYPAMKAHKDAAEALEEARKRVVALTEALLTREQARNDAQALADGDAESRDRLAEIAQEIGKIKRDLPQYKTLKEKLSSKRKAEASAGQAAESASKEEKRRDTLDAEIKALQVELESLSDADAGLVRRQQDYEGAKKTSEALSGKRGLRHDVDEINKSERLLAKEEQTLSDYAREALEAEEAFDGLYRRFVAGQAGLLAAELREEVEKADAATCPVCGSAVNREQIPRFAVPEEDTPSKEDTDAARSKWEQAEACRSGQETKTERLRGELEKEKSAAVKRASELLPDCADWASLTAPGYLDDAVKAAQQAESDAETAWKDAKKRVARQDECKDLKSEKEAERVEADKLASDYRHTESEQREIALEADSVVKTLQAQLDFSDEDAAKVRKSDLEREQTSLNDTIQAHADALEQARSAYNTAKGQKEEQERSLGKLENECAEALENRERVLSENGFLSPEEVERTLPDSADYEQWLEQERAAIDDYGVKRDETARRVAELQEQTKGKEPVDLHALDEAIQAAEQSRDGVSAAYVSLNALAENHKDVLAKATAAKQALSVTNRAAKRLEKLSNLAVGETGKGGKLSFDRYVMGAAMREILDMANQRLDMMSGGRYELVHRVEAERQDRKAGLDIDVLDTFSGQQRSSDTLSGGEAFFTSLSLALGLSDAVQNRAGGQRMDALFVDEGFGSLSDGVLDKALDALNQLTEGNRMVGIISHVDKLGESIPQQIRVFNTGKGSAVRLELV